MSARPNNATSPLRLNLGCGRNTMAGWVNVDWMALPGVDVVKRKGTVIKVAPIMIRPIRREDFTAWNVLWGG